MHAIKNTTLGNDKGGESERRKKSVPTARFGRIGWDTRGKKTPILGEEA